MKGKVGWETSYYIIKHQGYYIKETETYGVFDRTVHKDQAMQFTDTADLLVYIENELRLNVANVQVIKIETITTESEVVL